MKIKSFVGKSYKDALDIVKKEFGPDAVIMETEELRGDEFAVKITAAIDFDEGTNKSKTEFNDYLNDEFSSMNLNRSDVITDKLKDDIREIKSLLLEMKQVSNTSKNVLYNYLKGQGIKDEYLLDLVSDVDDENTVFEKISSEIKAGYRLANGKTVMLIGPTGVGKTTTIVKLASFAVKIGKKVGIINLDSFRLGAYEQMRVFCNLLGIPLCLVNDLEKFYETYSEFAKDKDIIFIDTTGRNPKDKIYLTELKKVKEGEIPLEIHLTVSLSMQDEIFIKAKDSYETLGVDYLILTKLDEACSYGNIYNIYKTYGKPVAYITNGQKIPFDIQAVSSTRIANLILKKGLIQ